MKKMKKRYNPLYPMVHVRMDAAVVSDKFDDDLAFSAMILIARVQGALYQAGVEQRMIDRFTDGAFCDGELRLDLMDDELYNGLVHLVKTIVVCDYPKETSDERNENRRAVRTGRCSGQ